MRVAILASFTIRGVSEALRRECDALAIPVTVYEAGYNQYAQEILDPASGLYANNPDLIIFFVDTRSLLGEYYFFPYHMTLEERRELVEGKVRETVLFVETIKKHSSAKILLHNFEVPSHSPLGILENKQHFGFVESIETINTRLRETFFDDDQVFVFDYNALCSAIGKKYILDHKMYYLGDIRLNPKHIPDLCRAYTNYIKPLLSLTKKCIVLDLDNTVWGGVIGEDGIEGIHLGPTPEGRSFFEFQKHLLSFFDRGVILAINSKNNPDDVMRAFREHPHMILKEKHFAATRINWDDKVANMRALAEELNVGLDSMVFIDDDALNRNVVRGLLPEVTVIDLPDDPALYSKTLVELDAFHTLQLTEEDTKRGAMYAQERQRKEFSQKVTDLTTYLRDLAMEVTIERASTMTIPRIAQLTQKTNQFNMTTQRYSEEEIRQFVESGHFMVLSLRVKDRFGDNGTVGVAIIEKENAPWRIDSFLLSCRVIGRGIENVLLAYIIEQAKNGRIKKIRGEFIPTKKNAPAKGFYAKNGFVKSGIEGEKELWEYDCMKEYPYPDFIAVIIQ